MNKDEECCNKFCLKRCPKCKKIKKKDHVCFKDTQERSARFVKSPVKNSKITKRTIEHHTRHVSEEVFKYDSLYNIMKKHKGEECFADALKDFFVLPKEEVSKTWKEQNINIEEILRKDSSINLYERKKSEFSMTHLIEETTSADIVPDIPLDIALSVQVSSKLFTRIPATTKKALNYKKMSRTEKIRRLLLKDFHSLNAKIKSKKIKHGTHRDEFIFKWFQNDFERKEKHLKSFSKVFKNIHKLESTRGFCLWLLRHPEIEPPSYLIEEDVFKEFNIQESSLDIAQRLIRESTEITDDFIKDHFQRLKFISAASLAGQSIDDRFISDVNFIV